MASNDDPYITEANDGSVTAHNYVLISVPHGSDTFYYKSAATEQPMTSFLRIGAVSGDDPTKEGGWDFAKLVVGFNDDTRTRPGDDQRSSGTVSQAISAHGSALADDVKSGMKAFYGADTALSADQLERVKESMRLHYRGGWRDHSAGNRISTTQGDKVELVRGNYKMVVMGRRPDQSDAKGDALKHGDYALTPVDTMANAISTTDVSGGHVQDWNLSPGQITEITWVKTDTGGGGSGGDPNAVPPDTAAAYYTWKTVEETVKGDVESTYYGQVTDRYLGPTVSTQIGWEGAPKEDDGARAADDASDEAIPEIYRDYPGLDRRNPIVTEHTWAREIENYRGSKEAYCGRIRETTYADHITVETHTPHMRVNTYTRNHVEDVYSDYHSTSYHGGDFRECWWGHFGELFLGASNSFKIGEFVDVRVGARIIELNAGVGVTELKVGVAVNELSVAAQKDSVFWGGQHNEFVLANARMSLTTGTEQTYAVEHRNYAILMFLL